MADYDWGPSCGCSFMGKHNRLCKRNPHYEANKVEDALIAKERARGFFHIGILDGTRLWSCRRGCGTVIWNTDVHVENVCPRFEPVAGG